MKDNKLIAVFMSMKPLNNDSSVLVFSTDRGNDIVSIDNLEYQKDWNLLMEVVEKINNTGRFEVVIRYGFCYITDGLEELTLSFPEKNTIYAVYKAVVEFIKWYNNGRV